MTLPQVRTLPAAALPDDVIDRVAKEIAAEVCDHIEAMYPDAAAAVAWNSTKRSIQGVVRNNMKSAGDAAEAGEIEAWFVRKKKHRREFRQMRRRVGWGYQDAHRGEPS